MIRAALGIVGLIVLVGLLFGSYKAGKDACKAEQADAIAESIEKDEKKVEYIVEYKEKIKVVYRDKINTYKKVQDPTGCADVKLIDMGFRLLPSDYPN